MWAILKVALHTGFPLVPQWDFLSLKVAFERDLMKLQNRIESNSSHSNFTRKQKQAITELANNLI